MEVRGIVVSWAEGQARIELPAGACAKCSQSCPSRSMAMNSVIVADAAEPLAPGQCVSVDISIPSPVGAATLAFGLPLAGLVAGLVIGNAVWAGQPLPTLGAALGGAASAFGLVAVLERRNHRRAVVVGPSPTEGGVTQ